MAHHWTQAEKDAFARAWNNGVPLRQIAQALGKTYAGCKMQRIKLGLPKRAEEGQGLAHAITVHITAETHSKLKRKAALLGLPISTAARTVLQEAL